MLDEHNESSAKRTTHSVDLVKAGTEKRMPKISMIVKVIVGRVPIVNGI